MGTSGQDLSVGFFRGSNFWPSSALNESLIITASKFDNGVQTTLNTLENPSPNTRRYKGWAESRSDDCSWSVKFSHDIRRYHWVFCFRKSDHLSYFLSYTCAHQWCLHSMRIFSEWYWATHKQKSAVSAVDYDWKVLSVFMLTNMIFHIQTLESFQG